MFVFDYSFKPSEDVIIPSQKIFNEVVDIKTLTNNSSISNLSSQQAVDFIRNNTVDIGVLMNKNKSKLFIDINRQDQISIGSVSSLRDGEVMIGLWIDNFKMQIVNFTGFKQTLLATTFEVLPKPSNINESNISDYFKNDMERKVFEFIKVTNLTFGARPISASPFAIGQSLDVNEGVIAYINFVFDYVYVIEKSTNEIKLQNNYLIQIKITNIQNIDLIKSELVDEINQIKPMETDGIFGVSKNNLIYIIMPIVICTLIILSISILFIIRKIRLNKIF